MKMQFLKATLFLIAITVSWSCGEKEKTPAPAAGLKAEAGADQDVIPNNPVALDGSASTGEATKTFGWKLLKKPALSQVNFGAASQEKFSFTPDIVGYYEIELTVADKAQQSTDKLTVKAEYTEPIILDKSITADTRLFDRFIDAVKPDYLVTKDILVSAALSIDRGVNISFERDKGISIDERGAVLSLGSDEQRISFTGLQAQRGFWAGIRLFSPGSANTFEFTDIQFAGSKIAFTNTKAGLALFGNNKAQVALKDCKFHQNGGFGLYVQNGSVLRQFARNSFSGQAEAGLLIDAYNASALDSKSSFSGTNGRDVVEISSSDIKDIQNVVWPAFEDGTPYRLLGNMAIETGWTLSPGVVLEAARDAMISVNRNGYLSAKGTATKKVAFKGATGNNANWRGIIFYSNSNQNFLENAEINGAGSSTIVSGQKAAVTAYGKGAKLTIVNSQISQSGGHAIMYTSDADINNNAEAANTFSGISQKNLFKL